MRHALIFFFRHFFDDAFLSACAAFRGADAAAIMRRATAHTLRDTPLRAIFRAMR